MTARILIVEDDQNMREIIALFLEQEGYEVTQAPDGEAALEALRAAPESYTVVLSDILMGAVDGIAVMHAARARTPAPEVLLLTGHGSLDTAIAAVRAGAFNYLLKPCDLHDLVMWVHKAVQAFHTRQREKHEAETGRRFAAFVEQLQHQGGVPPLASAAASPLAPDVFAPEAPAAAASSSSAPSAPDVASRYLRVGQLCVDTFRHEVSFDEQLLHMTPTEYDILTCLAKEAGRVVSFGDIVRQIRGYEVEETEARDLVRGHVRSLRQKFDRRSIVSVRGVGFMLVDPREEEDEPAA